MDSVSELTAAGRWRLAFARVGSGGLVVVAALFIADVAMWALRSRTLALDAANSYLPAAHELLHGQSPYHTADVAGGAAFVSPPVAAFLLAPFTLLPDAAAHVFMAVLMLAAAVAALRLIGVLDWRCYATACLSYPMIDEFQTANLSALLALCTALVWRYRDRAVIAGAAAGATVALKLFCWPLIVFLFVTRRFKAAAYAAAVGVGGILLPWAAVGFTGLGGYPHLLWMLLRKEGTTAYSLAALIAPVSSWAVGQAVAYLFGAALLLAAWRARNPERAFATCVAAALALTPIVWMHYFLLLLVLLAIAAPMFGPLWALPLVFWLSPRPHAPHLWQAAAVVAIEAALVATVFTTQRPRSRAAAPSWRRQERGLTASEAAPWLGSGPRADASTRGGGAAAPRAARASSGASSA